MSTGNLENCDDVRLFMPGNGQECRAKGTNYADD
jgi:hypothetical protein